MDLEPIRVVLLERGRVSAEAVVQDQRFVSWLGALVAIARALWRHLRSGMPQRETARPQPGPVDTPDGSGTWLAVTAITDEG